jgi:hypothetical protein
MEKYIKKGDGSKNNPIVQTFRLGNYYTTRFIHSILNMIAIFSKKHHSIKWKEIMFDIDIIQGYSYSLAFAMTNVPMFIYYKIGCSDLVLLGSLIKSLLNKRISGVLQI